MKIKNNLDRFYPIKFLLLQRFWNAILMCSMFKKVFYIALCSLCFVSCYQNSRDKELKKSALPIKPHQVVYLNIQDRQVVMHALASVVESEGFVIKNINYSLGFINAVKNVSSNDTSYTQIYDETSLDVPPQSLELTANVTPKKEGMRIKVNFVTKSFDKTGIIKGLHMVKHQKYYETFFDKIIAKAQPAQSRP